MQIELQRIHTPEELGTSGSCAICAGEVQRGVVLPTLVIEEHELVGDVCLACVEFMGRHPSGRFPTSEQYRRAESVWGTPLYASRAEAERAHGIISGV